MEKLYSKILLCFLLAAVCSLQATHVIAQVKTDSVALSDDARLQAYFSQNNLQPKKTPSGLYYIVKRNGYGPQIRKRQAVTLNYSSRLLDGTLFDSNTDPKFGHVEPLKVHTAQKEVIAGFDEGLMLLKTGAVATLFIPSALGYGAHPEDPSMPANAILVFDIEVTDVR